MFISATRAARPSYFPHSTNQIVYLWRFLCRPRRRCFKLPKAWFPYRCICRVCRTKKKFVRQIQLCGNLPYNRSIRQKRQIQLVVRDRMNSICPMKFFRTTDTTDATDTTIWKPGLYLLQQIQHEVGVIRQHFVNGNPHDKCNKNVSQNTPLLFSKWRRRSKVMLNARSPLSWRNVSAMNPFTTNSQKITRTNNLEIPEEIFSVFMFQLLH